MISNCTLVCRDIQFGNHCVLLSIYSTKNKAQKFQYIEHRKSRISLQNLMSQLFWKVKPCFRSPSGSIPCHNSAYERVKSALHTRRQSLRATHKASKNGYSQIGKAKKIRKIFFKTSLHVARAGILVNHKKAIFQLLYIFFLPSRPPIEQSDSEIEIRFSVAQNMQIYSSGKELHDALEILASKHDDVSMTSTESIKRDLKISHNTKETQGNTYSSRMNHLLSSSELEHSCYWPFRHHICIHIAPICNLNAILICDRKLVSCKFNFSFAKCPINYNMMELEIRWNIEMLCPRSHPQL